MSGSAFDRDGKALNLPIRQVQEPGLIYHGIRAPGQI
jgi:hypothetical protein